MDAPASPPDRKRRRRDEPQTLPPIRQLYLPSSDPAPFPPYAHQYNPHLPPMAPDTETYGAGPDSDADDGDQRGPPKKKRRRQALSCTECKRRKIKCDRNHPCTPCKRRGEEGACQWHSIEPVEKYATKAEFDALRGQLDALKARYDQLERVVQRLLPPAAAQALNPPPEPAPPPIASYYLTGEPYTAPGMYTMEGASSSSAAPRYMKTEGAQSPVRQPLPGPSTSSPTMSSTARHRPGLDTSPSMHERGKSSLAAITAPYHTDVPTAAASLPSGMPTPAMQPSSQPKNCHAQTLIPGERLRPKAEEGPAIFLEVEEQVPGRLMSTMPRKQVLPRAGAVVGVGETGRRTDTGGVCTGGRRAATTSGSGSAWARFWGRAGASMSTRVL